MRNGLFFVVILFLLGLAGTASAQGFGGLEFCSGDDPKCQTPGTVALSCLGSDEVIGDVSRWRDSGDGLAVNAGHWQMFYASNNQTYNCASVLVYRGGGQTWNSGLRICAGNDLSCQSPGQVAYACFLEAAAPGQPTAYQYTGDGIRVAGGRWQMWYSHNQQNYNCAAVLVGGVPYGSGFGSQFRLCAGDDPICQQPGTVPLLCDVSEDGFSRPANYYSTGRSMRVAGGRWEMLYPDQSRYDCQSVIVASIGYVPPPSQPNRPTTPMGAGLLPSGSVILFDGGQCPAGWARIGQVARPGTPVSGMSYCRRQ